MSKKKNLAVAVEAEAQLRQEDTQRQSAERLAHLQAKNRELAAEVQRLLASRGRFSELVSDLKNAVVAADPYPRVPYKAGELSSSPIEAVAVVSDWQTGEKILASATEGFGEFDWEIENDLVSQLGTKVIDWVNMHRNGFAIDTLNVFSLGDLMSGDIHQELLVTNEFPLPVQTAKAGLLFGEHVSRYAAHFKKVRVFELDSDNHGRLTRKPQHKQGTENNMMYLAHEIANSYLAKHKNVEIIRPSGEKFIAEVNGFKFLLEHGHNIQSHMGVPYYGMERMAGREARKRMGTDKQFDYIAMGHFHVPAIISSNILINGSLTGTTEFDHSQGRHSPPAQISFLIHPKHGMFDFTAWKFKQESVRGAGKKSQ